MTHKHTTTTFYSHTVVRVIRRPYPQAATAGLRSLPTYLQNSSMPNPLDASPIGHLRNGGAFNGGIEVWQLNDGSGTRLVKKIFRREDVPDHAEHEIAMLQRLKSCPYVTRIHGHKINYMSGSAHVFLECCDKGTLWDMIDLYRERGGQIPESFAWHIFWSVANAIAYLQHGPEECSPFSPIPNDWVWIFHRDIHPGNIFITGGERVGDHLHVLLGDFGSSITEDRDDDMQVHMQMQAFGIPERHMNPGSDVYQLGLVMVAVCRLTRNPHHVLQLNRRGGTGRLAGSRYSSKLNRLVKECLRTEPEMRIGITELVEEIDRAGMRNPHMRDRLRFPELEIIGGQVRVPNLEIIGHRRRFGWPFD